MNLAGLEVSRSPGVKGAENLPGPRRLQGIRHGMLRLNQRDLWVPDCARVLRPPSEHQREDRARIHFCRCSATRSPSSLRKSGASLRARLSR